MKKKLAPLWVVGTLLWAIFSLIMAFGEVTDPAGNVSRISMSDWLVFVIFFGLILFGVLGIVSLVAARLNRRYPTLFFRPSKGGAYAASPSAQVSEEAIFSAAIRVVADFDAVSAPLLQKKLRLDPDMAAWLLNKMEQLNIIGPAHGGGTHTVLMPSALLLERYSTGAPF